MVSWARDVYKRQWLLSSETTRDLWLYQDELEKNGIECITADDDQQAIITQVIKRVMGWIQDKSDICELGEIIENQKKKWITAVVLGCTELPLAITQDDISLPEYNANDVLVHTVVDKMYKIDG